MTLTAPAHRSPARSPSACKAEILAGERAPGSRLRQVEIARRFGVSTTPVREALATLQREGLVRLHPQRGAVVFLPSVDDLREHYEIRAALEALAAAKAAERFEPDVGAAARGAARRDARRRRRRRATSRSTSASTPALYEHCGRPQLVDDDRRAARRLERLPAHLPRRRRTSRSTRLDAEHREILAACVARDPERAAAATRDAPRAHRRARRRLDSYEAQHRTHPHHPHRQPPAPRRPDPDDVRQGGGRAGRPGRARRSASARRSPRSSRKQARRRRRRRQRRRDEQAELRHLHQGPPRRLRRRRASRSPTRTSSTSRSCAKQGVRRPRPLAPQDAGVQRRRSRCATRGARSVDVEHLQRRARRRRGRGGVHDRRLAGRDRAVLPQRPLRRRARSTSSRSPTRCATSTRRSPTPGFVLQIDCPDLGDGPPHPVRRR